MSAPGDADQARTGAFWDAQRRVVAKVLGELVYEGALPVVMTEDRGQVSEYEVRLSSGISYRFQAWRSIWGSLDVGPDSVTRVSGAETAPAECVDLLIDAQAELGLNDITLGHLLEEIQNTLFSEAAQRRSLDATSAEEMAQMSGPDLESLLDAHPKAIGNRGRLGWGAPDLAKYAPESATTFQLRWVAVRRGHAQSVVAPGVEPSSLLRGAMSEGDLALLHVRAASHGLSPEHDVFLPVHPWQWSRYIEVQYARSIEAGELVDLGVLGHRFRPQQSIRTLSNVENPGAHDIKLSLSILNTSCYRGIPAKFVEAGAAISGWVADIAAKDPVFTARGTVVLRDRGAAHCPQPTYGRVSKAPYRYHEMLGAVWRESAQSKLPSGRRVIPTAALFQCDGQGRPLLAEYVRLSGLSLQAWLALLFDRVAVPLHHFLCAHGVGIVAHGQNIGLVLEKHRPQGMVLKDFHGDVRLVDQPFEQHETIPRLAAGALSRLPAHHLVHDLFTGHFVTVLRFVSSVVERKLGLPERVFYETLAHTLRAYQRERPELAQRFAMFDLFQPSMERICINRARIRLGYVDSDARPLPDLGAPLVNPLMTVEQQGKDT